MSKQGSQRNLNRENEYWKLNLVAIGPIAASRRVRIGRTTGHRWRSPRGGVAPLRFAEAGGHARRLSLIDHEGLAVSPAKAVPSREISRRLCRSPSKISHDSRRYTCKHDRGQDGAVLSHPPRARKQARRGEPVGSDRISRAI
jgi:hypothetical protein